MQPWQKTIYRNLIHDERDLLRGGVERLLAVDEPHLSKMQIKWISDYFHLVRTDAMTQPRYSHNECVDELGEVVGDFVHYVVEVRLLERIHHDLWSEKRDHLDPTNVRLNSLIEGAQQRGLVEIEAMAEAWLSEMCERRKEQTKRVKHLARSMDLAKAIKDEEALVRLVPRYYANIGIQWGKLFERIEWIRTAVLQTITLSKRLAQSDDKHVLKKVLELLPRLHHNVIHLGEVTIAEQVATITCDLASRVPEPDVWKGVAFCQFTTASSLTEAGFYNRGESMLDKLEETLQLKKIPRDLKTSLQTRLVLLRLRLLEKRERYLEFTQVFDQVCSEYLADYEFYLKLLTMAVRVSYEDQHEEFIRQVLPPLAETCCDMMIHADTCGSYVESSALSAELIGKHLTPSLMRAQLAIAQGVHEYDFENSVGIYPAYDHLSNTRIFSETFMASSGWQTPEYNLAYGETHLALGKHLQQLGEHHSSLFNFRFAIVVGEKTGWTHDTIEARVPSILDALSASVEAHLLCGLVDQALGDQVQAERIAKAADERGQMFSAVTRASIMRCRSWILLHQGRLIDALHHATECWNFLVMEFEEGRAARSKFREMVKIVELISLITIDAPNEALEWFRNLTEVFEAPEVAETIEGQRAKSVLLSIEAMLLAEAGNCDDALAACDAFDARVEKINSKRFFLGCINARIKTAKAVAISLSTDLSSAGKLWIEAAHAWSSNFRFSYPLERAHCYLNAAESLVSQIKASHEDADFHEASLWSQQAIESIAIMRQFVSDPLKRLSIQKKWLRAYEIQAELFHLSRGTDYFGWNLRTYLQNSEAVRCRASTDLLGAPIIAEGDCPPWLKEQFEASRTSIQGHAVAKTSGDPNSPYSLPPNLREPPINDGEEVALSEDDLEDRIHQFVMAQRSIQQNTFRNVSDDAEVGVKDVDEIRSLLPPRTALLNFDVKARFTTVIVFTCEGYCVRKLDDFNRSTCGELAKRWRSGYEQSRDKDQMPDLAKWNQVLDDVLVDVSKSVLQPILNELVGVDSICIVPNRELHIFPWHALPIGGTARLIDVFDVSTVPSLTILKHLYGLPEQCGEGLLMAAKRRDQQLASMEGIGLGKLLEIPCRASGSIGLEDLVQQSRKASIWHYAGHAGHREENPLESPLTNVTPEKTDLKLRDVCSRFSFPAMQLATISGCETAMLIPNDLDEYVSFPLAFHCAGARNVISCLWCADQFACPLFFLQFYRNLQSGLSISAAHRGAIRWLRGEGEGSLKTIGDVRHELEQSFWTHAERKSSRNAWERRFNEWVDEDQETAPFADTALWAPFTCSGLAWRYVSITPSKAVMK
ncbi:CHAT domain-containing protein [Rhodopirellula baltica]|nr:CHAT domain-containing protein [Rhodopirellula baltica]